MSHQSAAADARASYRIRPSVPVAIVVVVVYAALFLTVGISSGIAYDKWFDTTSNTYRTAVLGLVVGTVFLVAFVAYTRWDMLWKDPERLPMSPMLWSLPVLFVVLMVIRFVGIDYSKVSGSLVVAILLAGVLVGFAEETLFRGIFLRAMREGARPDGQAALWTSIAFGLFHVGNVFMGAGVAVILQVFLAAGNGVVLYVFRRAYGLIVVAMVAHGLWDISSFLDGVAGQGPPQAISNLGAIALGLWGLVVALILTRRDKHLAMTPDGLVSVGSESAEPIPT